jgi:hypothetical protein
LANIIYEMSQEKVALITEEERATVTFLSEASELGIGVTNVLEIGPRYVKEFDHNNLLNFPSTYP